MDDQTYYNDTSLKQSFRVACHRSAIDIVIPQYIQRGMKVFNKYHTTRLPYRAFDSSFAGTPWGERRPLHEMQQTQKDDYIKHQVENFISLEMGVDYSLIFRSYFMYSSCGHSCWSQVSYSYLFTVIPSIYRFYCVRRGYMKHLVTTQSLY